MMLISFDNYLELLGTLTSFCTPILTHKFSGLTPKVLLNKYIEITNSTLLN